MMRIMITGSSGLIGSSLVPFLTDKDHQVTRLVRSDGQSGGGTAHWNPQTGRIDTAALEGQDAVVHLAGENIARGRWTAVKKARIRDSRVNGTKLLSEALAGLAEPPKVLVCASAIGYYGNRGSELLTETSPPGTSFLAEVCQAWEAAAEPARQKGIRVIHLRYGVVLSTAGGALARMLVPFKWGLGGRLGSGRQYMSWITLDDAVRIVYHAIMTDTLRGPANAVTPNPVTNATFTMSLGKVLRRPTLFPLPIFAVRLLFGEMANELLLASARVEPSRLLASDFRYSQPELLGALQHLLKATACAYPETTAAHGQRALPYQARRSQPDSPGRPV